jgi:hypothetical protein
VSLAEERACLISPFPVSTVLRCRRRKSELRVEWGQPISAQVVRQIDVNALLMRRCKGAAGPISLREGESRAGWLKFDDNKRVQGFATTRSKVVTSW